MNRGTLIHNGVSYSGNGGSGGGSTPVTKKAITDALGYTPANESIVAPNYILGVTYKTGQIVTYGNRLWKCLADNNVTPSEGANWTEISVGKELERFVVLSQDEYDRLPDSKTTDGKFYFIY